MESTNRTDRMLHESVLAFEAALAAGKEQVVTPQWPQNVLAVLDGSNQDHTTIELLKGLLPRYGGNVLVTTGIFRREAEQGEQAAIEWALAELSTHDIAAEGVLSNREESHDRIVEVLAKRERNLCILPCPFSHDIEELGATTLGTVVEVTLTRAEVPVLIVRGPIELPQLFDAPHLVIGNADSISAHAIRIALGLLSSGTGPQGTLAITFLYGGRPDPDVDEAVARGYETTSEELIPLLSRGLSSFLHRLMLLREANPGFRLSTRLVQPDGKLFDETNEAKHLHVVPMQRETHGISKLVHELVLSTVDPVIVVPR